MSSVLAQAENTGIPARPKLRKTPVPVKLTPKIMAGVMRKNNFSAVCPLQ
jgi:hypothetical protein